jgi:hypothetical protein
MNMINHRMPVQAQPLQEDPELEEKFHEVTMGKPQEDGESEISAPGVNALLHQIAGSTFKEFDRLIHELQDVRHLLQSEGERVQQEIVQYARLSKAALNSTRAIAKGMASTRHIKASELATGNTITPATTNGHAA